MTKIYWQGQAIALNEQETVLDALLRQNIDLAYSCKSGNCHTCMLQADEGDVTDSQPDMRASWKALGYFLPCICRPNDELTLSVIEQNELFIPARVHAIEHVSERICRVTLDPATPFDYHAGQFINLRRNDGLKRSYSLASLPTQDSMLEIHVQQMESGVMSQWIHHDLSVGDTLDICGPFGHCYYQKVTEPTPILLIGTGSGLAPLMGIVRDALDNNHQGDIYLYHGSRTKNGLYGQNVMTDLARQFDNFHYCGAVSGTEMEGDDRIHADDLALKNHKSLQGWQVYLCGHPAMVAKMKKRAYLAGAEIKHIYADPFITKQE